MPIPTPAPPPATFEYRGRHVRSRTREDLIRECYGILDSTMNSSDLSRAAEKFAELLMQLTGNTGVIDADD